MSEITYSGAPHHQRVLRAVTEFYAADPRMLAVLLFGSLARGNWDVYSDLDLDIVLKDGVSVNPPEELRRLCDALGAIGERAAAILPKRGDEGDVVLVSLLELSIRYHPLAATSPNIVESMVMLWGRIALEDIAVAGEANRLSEQVPFDILVGRCVRYALEADVALQRRQLWSAVEALHTIRDTLMEMYAARRGGLRPLLFFQAKADADHQAALGAILPTYDPASVQSALLRCLDLLEGGLGHFSGGKAALTDEQREVLRRIRGRQLDVKS